MNSNYDAESVSNYAIPAVEIERFDDAALVFLTESETFITVNFAAADLLELLVTEFGQRPFSPTDITSTLLDHFDLDAGEARRQSDQILTTWSAWGIFQPVGEVTHREPSS